MDNDDLLDLIDTRRFDVNEIVDRLNEFEDLPAGEQDSWEMGIWEFAGLLDAQHPLLALCGESNNDFCIVRDLDGSLQFIFETAQASRSWAYGPVYRQHLSELEIESYLEGPPEDSELHLSPAQLHAVLDALPDDPPGPVRSF